MTALPPPPTEPLFPKPPLRKQGVPVLLLSVQSRVIRHRGEDRQFAPRPANDLGPEIAFREDIIGIEVGNDPGIALDFTFELSRPPAGVSDEDTGPGEVGITVRVNHPDAALDHPGRLVRMVEIPEHDDRVGTDRATDPERSPLLDQRPEMGTSSATSVSARRLRITPKAP